MSDLTKPYIVLHSKSFLLLGQLHYQGSRAQSILLFIHAFPKSINAKKKAENCIQNLNTAP